MPISRSDHPLLYALNVERHRLMRWLTQIRLRKTFAVRQPDRPTPYRLTRHSSPLARKIGTPDGRLLRNKIVNLGLAADKITETVIRPGEMFSFWNSLGRPSKRRGYRPGMLLSQGRVIEGIGGGLCQMSNLLYWMFLHSPLTVTERYRHSFDVFPDSGRILPFGSGATVFYSYIDLQARNDTEVTFRIRIWLDDRFLYGELQSDRPPDFGYRIIERHHRFLSDEADGYRYRENDLYRRLINRRTGETVREEHLMHNRSRVMY